MNLKISYSCMSNVEKIISAHNSKTMKEFHNNQLQKDRNANEKKTSTCNSRTGSDCPVEGICMAENVIYEATIFPKENIEQKKIYIAISAGNWKQRFYNHRQSFTNRSKKNTKRHCRNIIGICWRAA